MELSEKRLQLYGLIRGCPMEEPGKNCPIDQYRKIPIKQQYLIAESIDLESLNSILLYHEVCLCEREAKYVTANYYLNQI